MDLKEGLKLTALLAKCKCDLCQNEIKRLKKKYSIDQESQEEINIREAKERRENGEFFWK